MLGLCGVLADLGPGHLRADCNGGTDGHSGRLLVLGQAVSGVVYTLYMRMRSEGYSTWSVCLRLFSDYRLRLMSYTNNFSTKKV